MTFLFVWDKSSLYRDFSCDISMYICVNFLRSQQFNHILHLGHYWSYTFI
jgi:hypothetical protein